VTFARDPINPNLVCDPDTGATVKCIGSNEIEEYWFEVAIGDWKFGFGGTVSDRPGGHENGRVGVWLSLEGFNLELVRRGRLNKPENNVLLAYLMPAIKLLIPNKLNGDYELWTSPSLEAFCRKNNVPQVIDIPRVDASGSP
jgi:hypothetical protein